MNLGKEGSSYLRGLPGRIFTEGFPQGIGILGNFSGQVFLKRNFRGLVIRIIGLEGVIKLLGRVRWLQSYPWVGKFGVKGKFSWVPGKFAGKKGTPVNWFGHKVGLWNGFSPLWTGFTKSLFG